jgi:hypothetical protein
VTKVSRLAITKNTFLFLIIRPVKILNFKSAQSLLSNLLARAARALLCELLSNSGFVGINNREESEYFRSEPILAILEHGIYVRAS